MAQPKLYLGLHEQWAACLPTVTVTVTVTMENRATHSPSVAEWARSRGLSASYELTEKINEY